MSSSSAWERMEPRPRFISRTEPGQRLRQLDVRADASGGAAPRRRGPASVVDGGGRRVQRVGRLRDHDRRGRGRRGPGGASASRRLCSTAANACRTIAGHACGVEPLLLQVVLDRDGGRASPAPPPRTPPSRPGPARPPPGRRAGPRGSAPCPARPRAAGRAGPACCTGGPAGTFSGTRRLASRLTFMFSKAAWFSLSSGCGASRPRTPPRPRPPAPPGGWRCTGPGRGRCRAGP